MLQGDFKDESTFFGIKVSEKTKSKHKSGITGFSPFEESGEKQKK